MNKISAVTIILAVISFNFTSAFAQHSIDVQRLAAKGEYFEALANYEKLPKRRANTEAITAAARSAWGLGLSDRAIQEYDNNAAMPIEDLMAKCPEIANEVVMDFIKENPEQLAHVHSDRLDFSLFKRDARHWLEAISVLEQDDTIEDIRHELYSGIVGKQTASSFIAFKKQYEKKLDYKTILNDYKSIKKTVIEYSSRDGSRLDQLNLALEQILSKMDAQEVTKEQVENFKLFLLDAPLEMAYKACKHINQSMFMHKDLILNDVNFSNGLKKAKTSPGSFANTVLSGTAVAAGAAAQEVVQADKENKKKTRKKKTLVEKVKSLVSSETKED